MALRDGYNTPPSYQYLQDIAGGVGSIGTTYYVDCNAGADTNDGMSWESAFKKLSVALAASHANIAAGATGWASRNRIFFKGDQTATADGENLTKLAQKTDIIGVGSTDYKPQAQLVGNHTIAATVQYLGCRFINVAFKGAVASGGDIFTVTGQHGLAFIGCTFDGSSTIAATAAIIATACSWLTIKGCKFMGAFSDAVIELGAGHSDDLVIEGSLIDGANMGIDIGAATFSAGHYGLIKDNVLSTTLACINDASNKVRVIGNRGMTLAAEGVGLAGAVVCAIKFAQDNRFTTSDKNNVIYPPEGTGA